MTASILKSLASILVVTCEATVAAAFCLKPDPSAYAEYSRSDAVFLGTVLSESTVPGDEEDNPGGWVYDLRVDRRFRGAHGQRIKVYTENSSARYPLDMGRRYLLFAINHGGQLVIGNCGNSGEMPQVKDRLAQVERARIEFQSATTALIEGRTFLAQKGPRVRIVIRSAAQTYAVLAGTDGSFLIEVPPGMYEAHAYLSGKDVPPYDLSYDNPRHFQLQRGECALVQFRADGMQE